MNRDKPWALYCLAASNDNPHLVNKKSCVFRCNRKRKPSNRSDMKWPNLDNIQIFWFSAVFRFWHLPSRRSVPVTMRLLFLMCMYCLLSTHVSSMAVTFPPGCIYSNSSTQEHTALVSINCSSLELLHYTVDFNVTKEYNTTKINSTTPDKDQDSLNDAFIFYYLDLSHNKLTSVDSNIHGDESSLNNTIQITTLIFSFNNITHVQAGHLTLYSGVLNLDLSYNNIQWMDVDVFTELRTVSFLNLSHNAIENLANSTFQFIDHLVTLDLSYNHLYVFDLSSPPVLSSLEYLYLNDNNLHSVTSLTSDVESNISRLTLLDLSNNQLKEFHSGTFKSFTSLKRLDVANNVIHYLNEYFLAGLHSLEDLTLDQNNISTISKPVFQGTSLVRLSIALMPSLSNISHDAFLGLSNLVYLNLSHNHQLSFLQPNLFTPLANLLVLDVSNSDLTQLSQITFHNNKNLHQIHLLNNPLTCSCTNAWLGAESANNQSRIVAAHSLYCLSDNEVLAEMNNASFNCEEIFIHNMTSRIIAKLGSRLLFKCQHESENPGVVMWTTPSGMIFYQHHFHPEASRHLLTPEDIEPGSEFHKGHYWHYTSSYHSELSSNEKRVSILSDGSLYIDYMLRQDPGPYKCQVSNAQYNHTVTINLYAECTLSSNVKIFGCITGLICALSFFTLNLIYVIISWTARRLVNKRRREIIRQMLENMNAYKSTQIARIHENYTHQLHRVRNQYHIQCERLQKNYTSQVTKVKRGCSNQVERVRDNYNAKLTQLREYSSNQILQIRERTNGQIVRIRDYGATQLDRLRETYKLQQQHVLKLLDTMNLENCRTIVETECMRAESMMYDIDLLGDDDRMESPSSMGDSEYSTAATSPSSSPDVHNNEGLSSDMSHAREFSSGSSENSGVIVEMETTVYIEPGVLMDVTDTWRYHEKDNHEYLMKINDDPSLLQLQDDDILFANAAQSQNPGIPLPMLELNLEQFRTAVSEGTSSAQGHNRSDSDIYSDALYMTPEASPTKVCSEATSQSTFNHSSRSYSNTQDSDNTSEEIHSFSNESIV